MAYQDNPERVYMVPMQQDADGEVGWTAVPLPPGVPVGQFRPPPQEPPPGLTTEKSDCPGCHEIQLVSDPPAVLTNRDVTLFSHIAAFIDEDGIDSRYQPKIDLECVICRNYKLEMPRHASKHAPGDEGADVALEPFTVAPCGHIFGFHCLANWVMWELGKGETPRCPVCRDGLAYKQCGHLIRVQPYNVHVSRQKQLPWTVHEGGRVPPFCEDCEMEMFDEQLQELNQTIYPEESPMVHRDPGENGARHTNQLRDEMSDRLWKRYLEHRASLSRW